MHTFQFLSLPNDRLVGWYPWKWDTTKTILFPILSAKSQTTTGIWLFLLTDLQIHSRPIVFQYPTLKFSDY